MKKRILIADDDAAIVAALCDYFSVRGHRVDGAHEPEEAEALLACLHYDVVIPDLRLTGFGGTEGFSLIGLAKERNPNARVVLMTGNATPEIEEEAKRLGADAVITKPVALSWLEEVATSAEVPCHA